MRVQERDREAAGTLLGSALALRMFLFFMPLVLLGIGIAGLLGNHTGVDSVSGSIGLSDQLGAEIDHMFRQDALYAWISLLAGLIGAAWSARSLTRALTLSSAMAWRIEGVPRTPARAIGVMIGIYVGIALVFAIVQRVRASLGLAVTSISFAAAALLYAILWSALLLSLPRATTDPGAALPGGILLGGVLAALHAISQFWIPGAIDGSSVVYSTVAAAFALLGWFFFLGRSVAFAFALNAVVYERHGSISGWLFALPVLRAIPRRSEAFARFFDL